MNLKIYIGEGCLRRCFIKLKLRNNTMSIYGMQCLIGTLMVKDISNLPKAISMKLLVKQNMDGQWESTALETKAMPKAMSFHAINRIFNQIQTNQLD